MIRAPALVFLCACAPIALEVPSLVVPGSLSTEIDFGLTNVVSVPVENRGTADVSLDASTLPPLGVFSELLIAPAGGLVEVPVTVIPSDAEPVVGLVSISTRFSEHVVLLDLPVDADADDDGHDALEAGGDDCDDRDPEISPSAPEEVDGEDQDCDGEIDEP